MTETLCGRDEDFSELIQLFIELRGKGVSISPMDINIVAEWKRQKINPQVLKNLLVAVWEECISKQSAFPSTMNYFFNLVNRSSP